MEQSSLSERGKALSKDVFTQGQEDHFAALDDLYDPTRNSNGYINMGASESTLVNTEVISLIDKVQARTQLKPEDLHYYVNYGSEAFRGAIASHWEKSIFQIHNNRHISAEDIVLSTGCTVILDMLAHMICDPGDVLLVPVPCYAMFELDVGKRAGAVIAGVDAGATLDVSVFEQALASQRQQGKKVRGVLLSSPNNPVGTVYTKSQLQGVVEFCMKHDLEIVSDELYSQTVFDSRSSWISLFDVVPDEYQSRVHVVHGFAKDFSLPGFKVGFAISFNREMIAGLRNLAYFAPVSNYAQFILTGLLHAPELNEFMDLYRKRLGAAYEQVKHGLHALGIPTRPAQGGMFVMADFSRYLTEPTFECELRLAGVLHRDLKVNIAPGVAYKEKSPGWLRICYAQEQETIEELLRRLGTLAPV